MKTWMKGAALAALMVPAMAMAEEAKGPTCFDIRYSLDFLNAYPQAPSICEEVKVVDGVKYAKMDATVVKKHEGVVTVAFKDVFGNKLLNLSVEASQAALQRSGITPDQVGMVVFASTTGFATPSLDSKLIECLGLRRNTPSIPVWGLGCAAGVAGMARASELARTLQGRYLLFVAVELCSLTFQLGDLSKANLVGASLFADGAAAVLLGEEADGPEILGAHSHLFHDSEDIMGWDFTQSGMKIKLSRDLPSFVKARLPEVLAAARTAWGVNGAEIVHYAVHPGGAKVLQALAEMLSLEDRALEPSYHVLHNYGNMSSPSVLFALNRVIETRPRQSALGLMLAFGPGFSAEQLLFRW